LPGEYHIVSKSGAITTLLGSCVAVVLYDSTAVVGGMNHFMLPESIRAKKFYLSSAGKYGMYAMELLINGLIKAGGHKKNFKAKVFGGGSVLGDAFNRTSRIPESNIRMALDYLKEEDIPVVTSDVGGDQARKVYFILDDYKVYMRKIEKNKIKSIKEKELSYLEKISRKKEENKGIKLF